MYYPGGRFAVFPSAQLMDNDLEMAVACFGKVQHIGEIKGHFIVRHYRPHSKASGISNV